MRELKIEGGGGGVGGCRDQRPMHSLKCTPALASIETSFSEGLMLKDV